MGDILNKEKTLNQEIIQITATQKSIEDEFENNKQEIKNDRSKLSLLQKDTFIGPESNSSRDLSSAKIKEREFSSSKLEIPTSEDHFKGIQTADPSKVEEGTITRRSCVLLHPSTMPTITDEEHRNDTLGVSSETKPEAEAKGHKNSDKDKGVLHKKLTSMPEFYTKN